MTPSQISTHDGIAISVTATPTTPKTNSPTSANHMMTQTSSTIGERRRPKLSERPTDGLWPSQASVTTLKHAVNPIRNVTNRASIAMPKPTKNAASGVSTVVGARSGSSSNASESSEAISRMNRTSREHEAGDTGDKRLPVAEHDLDPRVEDLANTQGAHRGRSHGREGTRSGQVYAPPPAMAGRMTSVSDSPTEVSSPSSTRTSSSLRYTLT